MDRYLSVSELMTKIKSTMERNFRHALVQGEVSNLSSSGAGHWYFSLSDRQSTMSCAVFRMDALRNPEIKKLQDGDQVTVSGPLSVYSKRGTFQLVAKRIARVGKGDLKEQFENLKKRLAQEGLFDIESKLVIPAFPKRVAVITAEKGAALQDFLNIIKRRHGLMDILLIPALVQGDNAPASLRKALFGAIKFSRDALEKKKLDLIIITRGGGSMEDLWAFNDEGLAWDMHNCPIPIISAVGHQVDYTICDFVSDLRAETPSAAAEMITKEGVKVQERMERCKKSLLIQSQKLIRHYNSLIDRYHPKRMSDKLWSWFYRRQSRLKSLDIRKRLWELTNIHEFFQRLDDSSHRLNNMVNFNLKERARKVEDLMNVLNALNPNNVLRRGYTYLKSGDRVIGSMKNFKALEENKFLQIQFHDGEGLVQKKGKEI